MESVISCFFILRATRQSAAIWLCFLVHPQNCERLRHVCSSVCLSVHPSVCPHTTTQLLLDSSKQSCNRPIVAQRVPGGLGSQIP
jgi:hypothetical protein